MILFELLKYWREITVCGIVLAVAGVFWYANHAHEKILAQEQEITMLRQEVTNAKDAVKFQSDVYKAWGRIDDKTYQNISSILTRPVPRIVVRGGVL